MRRKKSSGWWYIRVHPVQVVIQEEHFEFALPQGTKSFFGSLGELRVRQTLPKPRDTVLRVFHDENWPVSRNVKFAQDHFTQLPLTAQAEALRLSYRRLSRRGRPHRGSPLEPP